MSVNGNGIAAAAGIATEQDTPTRKTGDSLDKDSFLQLLVAQLVNQNPLEPQDNNEFMSQLSLFSIIEQLENLNNSQEQVLTMQVQNYVAQFLGKEVKLVNDEGQEIQGAVQGVKFGQNPKIVVNDQEYDISSVMQVMEP